MNIKTSKHGSTIVLFFKGELDINSKEETEKLLKEHLEKNMSVVCINCAGLTYIDSSGLGILISLSKIAKEKKFELVISDINSKISCVFDITKLDQFFKIMSHADFSEQYLQQAI